MDGIARIKDRPRGDRHRRRRPERRGPPQEPLELQRQPDRPQARQHHRQPQRPDMPPQQRLREEQHIEMERPVVVRWVVMVESRPRHLVHEPAIHPLVEMRRLHPQQHESQHRGPRQDERLRPAAFQEDGNFAGRGHSGMGTLELATEAPAEQANFARVRSFLC